MYRYLNLFNSRINSYNLIGFFVFIVFLLFNFQQIKTDGTLGIYSQIVLEKTHRASKLKFLCTAAETWIMTSFMYDFPVKIIMYGWGDPFYSFTGGTSAVVYFCWIVLAFPLFFAGAFLAGVKPFQRLDLLTPVYPLTLIYAKLACFCGGCCNGIETADGFYNEYTNLREFPVQLVESAEALVIFLIMMKIRKKAKSGTMFPLYLVFYSGMRFFSEFLRAQPDVLGPLKCAQIFCIAAIVLGFAGFVLAEKYAAQIDGAFFEICLKTKDFICRKIRMIK